MKKVVVDTNVLLVSISTRSSLHWVFRQLLDGKFTLCVTTDVLAEYAEIIEQQMGHIVSEGVMGVLENIPNVKLITSYYRFDLLHDKDDNKFVDCAIAANADFIVTHDRHFNVLAHVPFPKVEVIDVKAFKEIISLGDGTV